MYSYEEIKGDDIPSYPKVSPAQSKPYTYQPQPMYTYQQPMINH